MPTTTAPDWVSERLAFARDRKAAMARHPAGKSLAVVPRDPGPRPNWWVDDELLDELDRIHATIPPFEEAAGEVYAELLDVLVSKQNDYGPKAINDAPGGALNGVNVRLHDKYARLRNLTYTKTANHESLRDTYLDLANYAVIALLLLDGTWPK